ncbi:MAG: hypothetical protein M0R06_18090 [Sphaerochaeta sp.]|jgi:hypothetical protein|nr:hypothetical protein [Sphaerochaeta sp.]
MRKTVTIQTIVDEVNHRNKVSTCNPQVREGWNALLEGILLETDTYGGYRYLEQCAVPEGQLPGIVRTMGDPIFPDETRRVYRMRQQQ